MKEKVNNMNSIELSAFIRHDSCRFLDEIEYRRLILMRKEAEVRGILIL